LLAREGSGRDQRARPSAANHGSLLNRLGRHQEGAPDAGAEPSASLADRRPQHAQPVALDLSTACRNLGDLACAEAAVREGVEAMRTAKDAGSIAARCCRSLGCWRPRGGDVDGARRLLSER
jgi:hypothetical protein